MSEKRETSTLSKHITALLIAMYLSMNVYAQSDTLWVKGGDVLTGEIESMDYGVLVLDADYGDEDFKITWMDIVRIKSVSIFRITIKGGDRFVGSLESDGSMEGTLNLITNDSGIIQVRHSDITVIEGIEEQFKDRIDLGFEIGMDYGNILKTGHLSFGINAGYKDDHMELSTKYNSYATVVDTVINGRRDANIGYAYFFGRRWYGLADIQWFSSDAQQINLMTTVLLGFGSYLVKDQKQELALTIGADYNQVNYEVADDRKIEEAFLGLSYNLFDGNDIELETSFFGFKGFEKMESYRMNYGVDLSVDLFSDFDLSLGYQLNYDNDPPEDTKKGDYVVSLTFGWEL